MANLHKEWIATLVSEGLAKYADASITVKDVPAAGDKAEVPFQKVEFTITDAAGLGRLYELAEASRTTDKEGVKSEHPLNTLLTYAYGLNCRAKVRAEYEAKFEDPDKAIKKIAESLVKSGRFKSFDKALAAAKLLQEDDEE